MWGTGSVSPMDTNSEDAHVPCIKYHCVCTPPVCAAGCAYTALPWCGFSVARCARSVQVLLLGTFSDLFFQIFFIYTWLNLWTQSPQIWRADVGMHCVMTATTKPISIFIISHSAVVGVVVKTLKSYSLSNFKRTAQYRYPQSPSVHQMLKLTTWSSYPWPTSPHFPHHPVSDTTILLSVSVSLTFLVSTFPLCFYLFKFRFQYHSGHLSDRWEIKMPSSFLTSTPSPMLCRRIVNGIKE